MRARVAIGVAVTLAAIVGGAAPGAAKGGPEDTERVFVRTTDDDVRIRAYTGTLPEGIGSQPFSPASCEGAGCPPKACRVTGALVIGFSTDAAVSEGYAELYPLGREPARVVMASGFGTMFDAPAAWVAVQTGASVARVRATFRGGASDEMAPRDHFAVLASPVRKGEAAAIEHGVPEGRFVAFDGDGKVVARARFGRAEPFPSPPAACRGGLDDEFPKRKGPPPADEEGSRAAVIAAVNAAYHPGSDVGTAVERGAELAEVVQIAADRHPQYRNTIGAQVEEVRFIDATHAAVRFALTTDGQVLVPPGVGRVVLIDGTWLLSRDTFCRLLQLGGVYCPKAGAKV